MRIINDLNCHTLCAAKGGPWSREGFVVKMFKRFSL
jgi:hypothetical protein